MCDTPLPEMVKETYAGSVISRFRRFFQSYRGTTGSIILFLVLASTLRAQERVRTSAEAPLITSYRRSPEAFFYLGPFQEELAGALSVQYTDNVDLSHTNKISDLSFTGALNLNTTWVISHLNQVEFNFGGDIINHFYGTGRTAVDFAIAPNSKIEFKFEVGDYKVRLYDQFSYTQNPTSDPSATNTANLNSLSNTIGVAVDSDLNIAVLTLSADYTYNTQSGTNSEGQTAASTTGSRQTFRAGPTLTFRLSPVILYGINIEATRSSSASSANVNSLNFGPFINGKLSREFEFDLAVGASIVHTKPSVPLGYFYSADFRYQINRHWQLIFSGSHELIFTTGTGLTEENLFRLGTQLDLTRFTTFSLAPFVDFGEVKTTVQNSTSSQGPYTQFGITASLGWTPRKRWSTSLSYNFVRRESSATFGTGTLSSQNYIQNMLSLSVGYSF
jgi:hypothetical protein